MAMKPHILIVDDEEQTLRSMKVVLTGNGYKVSSATNGRLGLKAIYSNETTPERISIIITDINMPVMDGMVFIDEVRKFQRQIPILVATGFGNKEMLAELIRKGVSDFLEKPLNPPKLRKVVAEILGMETD